MKGLSFWQWLGILILISAVGGILFRVLYGNKLIDTANKNTDTSFRPYQPTITYNSLEAMKKAEEEFRLKYFGK